MSPEQKPNLLIRILRQEDWLSLIIAFLIILLSVIGVLGKNGLNISF